jgi:cobalamin biosynthesis Mg chelatase CobN
VIGEIATLSEAVTMGVQEPDEEELCDLAKKLGAAKKELMVMGRDLVVNQPTATEAHELVSEAGEAIKASQETITAALRGMGAASDISKISCLAGLPRPPPARPSMGNLAPPAWPP